MAIKRSIIDLCDHTPLDLCEASEIIDIVGEPPAGRAFIIINEEVPFDPINTFFERAKQAAINGKFKNDSNPRW